MVLPAEAEGGRRKEGLALASIMHKQSCSEHPTMPREAPTKRNYQAQMSKVPCLRNLVKVNEFASHLRKKKIWRKMQDIFY